MHISEYDFWGLHCQWSKIRLNSLGAFVTMSKAALKAIGFAVFNEQLWEKIYNSYYTISPMEKALCKPI